MNRPRLPVGAALAALVLLSPMARPAAVDASGTAPPPALAGQLERLQSLQRRDAGRASVSSRLTGAPGAEVVQVSIPGVSADKGTPPRLDGTFFQARTFDLASAGDIDGNGTTDWLRGEAAFTGGALTGSGHVFVDRRAPNGTITTLELLGPVAFGSFGHQVASAGDVNGDGFDEVIVGAPHVVNSTGRAFVFRGSANGLVPTLPWNTEGAAIQDHLGFSVACAGDVNGDGFDDVVVGSPGASSNAMFTNGRVDCFLGGAGGLALTPAWTVEGTQSNEAFGWSVAGNGDINGDGYADVAVTSPFYADGQAAEGRVQVFLGSAAGLALTSSFEFESNNAFWGADAQVALPGDMNGDGYGELVIGLPNADSGASDDGRVYIFGGSAFPFFMPELWTINGGPAGMHFGYEVMPAGDLNGDGFADFLSSAPDYVSGFLEHGVVLEHWGTSNLAPSFAPYTYIFGTNSERIGLAIAGGGDRGDGKTGYLVTQEPLPFVEDPPPTESASGVPPIEVTEIAGVTLNDDSGRPNLPYMPARSFAQGSFYENQFGLSVALADVNGDGFSDVIAGGPLYSEFMTNQGHVHAYYGDPAGFSEIPPFARTPGGPTLAGGGIPTPIQSPDWTFTGPSDDSFFGYAVANAGDVNGDGYDDVLVGAYLHSNGNANEGAAYVFLGGPDGLGLGPEWVVEGNVDGEFFGYAVGTAGDVNQDGYDDILVGAPLASPPGLNGAGRVSLYYGSASGPAHSPARVFVGSAVGASLGIACTGIGDVDGDGYPEIAMSEPNYGGGVAGEGRVLVYKGGPGGVAIAPILEWESGLLNSFAGIALGPAGDVNGDGHADLLVGAYNFGNVEVGEGAIHLFLGSPLGLTQAPDQTIEGGFNGMNLGTSVWTAGDLDKDGYGDVIAGGPGWLDGAPAPGGGTIQGGPSMRDGRCHIYFGTSTGLDPTPRYSYTPNQTGYPNGGTGRAVTGGGDINGDGWPDIVFSAPRASIGKLFENGVVFAGFDNVWANGLDRPARLLRSDNTTPIAHGLRSDLASSFRVRGTARSPVGRGKVRLQWQAKSPAQPFDGTGIGSSSLLRTGPIGPTGGSSIALGGTASGLASGQRYRVRTRLATRHPYFHRSPWFTSARDGLLEMDLRTAGPTGFVEVVDPPAATRGLSFTGAAPNPLLAGEAATLRFALAAPGRVTIEAWDAAGRRVARVLDDVREAGPSTVAWDGRDDAGRALPRGLYFLRLVSGGEHRETKVVIAAHGRNQ